MAYYNTYAAPPYANTVYQPTYAMPQQEQIGLASYAGAYQVNQTPNYSAGSYSSVSDTEVAYNPLPSTAYSYPDTYKQSGYISNYGSPVYGDKYQASSYSYSQPAMSTQQIQASASSGTEMQTTLEDASQLAPQIEKTYEEMSNKRRQPVVKRQVITIPGQPGRVQTVVRRLPTPSPDIIERVFVIKPHQDVVNLIIERPKTPPAQFRDKQILGKPRRPIIQPRIVSVESRNVYQYPEIQWQNPNAILPPPTPSFAFQRQISQSRVSQGSRDQLTSQSSSEASRSLSRSYLVAPAKYEQSASHATYTQSVQATPTYTQATLATSRPETTSYAHIQQPPSNYAHSGTQPLYQTGVSYTYTATAYPSYFAPHAGGYAVPYGARPF